MTFAQEFAIAVVVASALIAWAEWAQDRADRGRHIDRDAWGVREFWRRVK